MIIINTPIQAALLAMGNEKYRDFCSNLMPTVEKSRIIGIPTPALRAYAKRLESYEEFLNHLPHVYFEENNLHAFLIERECNFEKCLERLEAFLPHIDNWATCDCMKPPVLKKYPAELLSRIRKWIESEYVYEVRYGINLLMSFYLDENFSSEHLAVVAGIKSEEYYINMMRAWYFATALAKQQKATLPVLENNTLDVWTHNKTIQKARESRRISPEQKDYLKTLRRSSLPKGAE